MINKRARETVDRKSFRAYYSRHEKDNPDRTVAVSLLAAHRRAPRRRPRSATAASSVSASSSAIPPVSSAKGWIAPTNALDFGLGFWGYGVNNRCFRHNGNTVCNRYGYNNGTFNMDYLWQSNIVRGQAQLDWHVGAGGRAIWWGDCNGDCSRVAARAPIGLDLMFNNPGFLEVFFEMAPVVRARARLLVRHRRRPGRPLLLLTHHLPRPAQRRVRVGADGYSASS